MRKFIGIALIAALAALPAVAGAQRTSKAVGSSWLGTNLTATGQATVANFYRDNMPWPDVLRLGQGSTYASYHMQIFAGPGFVLGASEYRYPNAWPLETSFAGKTRPFVTQTGSHPHLSGDGPGVILPSNSTKFSAPVKFWKQAANTISVEGRDNTARISGTYTPKGPNMQFFAADGEKVDANIWSDQAVVTRSVYLGAGMEATVWLYGSGTYPYNSHSIVTYDFHHTGRVMLTSGQPGYYTPGEAGKDHWATAIPAEIAAEKPTLKGFIFSNAAPPSGIAYGGIVVDTYGATVFNEPSLGGNDVLGRRLYIYDDVNKMFYQTDGEAPSSIRKDIQFQRGDPVFALGPTYSAWNVNVLKDAMPGEFMTVGTAAVVYLHVDGAPVDLSASPTLANPTLANAKNLGVNALTDPALIGTEKEQPFQARIGEDTPIYPPTDPTVVYNFLTGQGLGARAARIGQPLNWLDRAANKGKFDFKTGKWQAGLDHATLDYNKPNSGQLDKSLGYAISFGPWDVPYDKHIHVALAYVAGVPDRALNQIMGQFYAKKKWLTRSELDQLNDLLTGWDYLQTYAYWKDTFAKNAGKPFTEKDKHEFLNSAIDSLYKQVGIVKKVWADGLAAGRFGPSYPAFVGWPATVSYTGGPGSATLTWAAVPGAARYNVYRQVGNANKQPRPIATGVTGTTYTDTNLDRGVFYYYAVSAVDAQGREGAWMMTQGTNAVVPTRVPSGAGWQDRVRIVPNPVSRLGGQEKDGGFNYTGGALNQNSVQFVNIPAKCTINIFTTTGDLVASVRHTSGTGDEAWYLVTDNNQRPVSGIYLCHIRNDDNPSETKLLKLVVLR